jgi:GNAT superfamily N-acetyltransferase
MTDSRPQTYEFHVVEHESDLPSWITRDVLAEFLHTTMKPWEDTLGDIQRAFDYCFSNAEGKGGFMLLAEHNQTLAGATVILRTGMGGFVPGFILLFISVASQRRGQGLGRMLVERAISRCDGPVKLHVEYDNPAKRLYERVGFRSKYAEMRYVP